MSDPPKRRGPKPGFREAGQPAWAPLIRREIASYVSKGHKVPMRQIAERTGASYGNVRQLMHELRRKAEAQGKTLIQVLSYEIGEDLPSPAGPVAPSTPPVPPKLMRRLQTITSDILDAAERMKMLSDMARSGPATTRIRAIEAMESLGRSYASQFGPPPPTEPAEQSARLGALLSALPPEIVAEALHRAGLRLAPSDPEPLPSLGTEMPSTGTPATTTDAETPVTLTETQPYGEMDAREPEASPAEAASQPLDGPPQDAA